MTFVWMEIRTFMNFATITYSCAPKCGRAANAVLEEDLGRHLRQGQLDLKFTTRSDNEEDWIAIS